MSGDLSPEVMDDSTVGPEPPLLCSKSQSASCLHKDKIRLVDIFEAPDRERKMSQAALDQAMKKVTGGDHSSSRLSTKVSKQSEDQQLSEDVLFYKLACMFAPKASPYDIAGARLLTAKKKKQRKISLSKVLNQSCAFLALQDSQKAHSRKHVPAFVSADLYNLQKMKLCRDILLIDGNSGAMQGSKTMEGNVSQNKCKETGSSVNEIPTRAGTKVTPVCDGNTRSRECDKNTVRASQTSSSSRGGSGTRTSTAWPDVYPLRPLGLLLNPFGDVLGGPQPWRRKMPRFCHSDDSNLSINTTTGSGELSKNLRVGVLDNKEDTKKEKHNGVKKTLDDVDEQNTELELLKRGKENVLRWIVDSQDYFTRNMTEVEQILQDFMEDADANHQNLYTEGYAPCTPGECSSVPTEAIKTSVCACQSSQDKVPCSDNKSTLDSPQTPALVGVWPPSCSTGEPLELPSPATETRNPTPDSAAHSDQGAKRVTITDSELRSRPSCSETSRPQPAQLSQHAKEKKLIDSALHPNCHNNMLCSASRPKPLARRSEQNKMGSARNLPKRKHQQKNCRSSSCVPKAVLRKCKSKMKWSVMTLRELLASTSCASTPAAMRPGPRGLGFSRSFAEHAWLQTNNNSLHGASADDTRNDDDRGKQENTSDRQTPNDNKGGKGQNGLDETQNAAGKKKKGKEGEEEEECPEVTRDDKSQLNRQTRCGQGVDTTEESFLVARNCLIQGEQEKDSTKLCRCFYKEIKPKGKLTIDRILKLPVPKVRRTTLCAPFEGGSVDQHASDFAKRSKVQSEVKGKEPRPPLPGCEDPQISEDFFQHVKPKPQISLSEVVQTPEERFGVSKKEVPEYLTFPGPVVSTCKDKDGADSSKKKVKMKEPENE